MFTNFQAVFFDCWTPRIPFCIVDPKTDHFCSVCPGSVCKMKYENVISSSLTCFLATLFHSFSPVFCQGALVKKNRERDVNESENTKNSVACESNRDSEEELETNKLTSKLSCSLTCFFFGRGLKYKSISDVFCNCFLINCSFSWIHAGTTIAWPGQSQGLPEGLGVWRQIISRTKCSIEREQAIHLRASTWASMDGERNAFTR